MACFKGKIKVNTSGPTPHVQNLIINFLSSSTVAFFFFGPPASMTSRLASETFKMAIKVFIEEADKNFDFITEILFRFLGFGDFKVPIVIKN